MTKKQKLDLFKSLKDAVIVGIKLRVTFISKKRTEKNFYIDFFKLKNKFWLIEANGVTTCYTLETIDEGLMKFIDLGYGKQNTWNNEVDCYIGQEEKVVLEVV